VLLVILRDKPKEALVVLPDGCTDNYFAATIRRYLMSNAPNNFRIDYIEFPAIDIANTKAFYQGVFGWNFKDYGPDYTSFHDGRISGGFTTEASVSSGGVLIVLYATDLKAVESKIRESGGSIVKEAFDFPGGRRFHFADPSGNVLAVWSEQ